MNRKTIYAVLILIVFFGGFLRFYNLGATAFDRDEFFELNTSYGYFKTGQWLSWDFGDEKPFPPEMQDDTSTERAEIFRWQLARLYDFAEPSEALTRGLGAAWGVIGIILVYFIAVSLTGNVYIGLIAAFLMAIGQSEIIYSRRLRMYAMFFPIYLLFSWTVFKFYESEYKGKIRALKKLYDKFNLNFTYLLPALIAGFVSYNTHMLTAHIAATVIAYAVFLLIMKLKKKSLTLKNIRYNKYFLTAIAAIFGFIIYQLPIFKQLHKLINKNFRFFLAEPNYDFFNQYFSDFTYPAIGAVLFVFGAWFLFKKLERRKESAFLFFSAAIPLAFAIFTWRRDVSQRYIYFLQSFGIILSAIGIYGVIDLAIARIKNHNYKKIAAIALGVAALSCINFNHISFKNSELNIAKANSYYPDFEKVFDYVIKNKKPADVMITRAYRSFYWRGENIKVYDIKSLEFGSKNCDIKINNIVRENPGGWAIYPKIDKITMCSAGIKYYENNFTRVNEKSIPSSVLLYKWE